MMIEYIGYTGSVLVAISLTMSNIWRLRWINLAGSILFMIYGLFLGLVPVAVVNAFITLVNLYYLRQLARNKDYFSLLPVDVHNSRFMQKFITFHKREIKRFFPEFTPENLETSEAVFILRNMIPVGLFVFHPHDNGEIHIDLDYVIPSYRDLKNAHFMFHSDNTYFEQYHASVFLLTPRSRSVRSYAERMGFTADPDNPKQYHRMIPKYS